MGPSALLTVAVDPYVVAIETTEGALPTWGHNFSADYVSSELGSQNISFPDADALKAEGRTDLLDYAGQQLDTGDEAEAYAWSTVGTIAGIAAIGAFAAAAITAVLVGLGFRHHRRTPKTT